MTKSRGIGKGNWVRTDKNRGANHHRWKGDDAGYHALHKWVQSRLGKPNKCQDCFTTTAPKFEWANISGKYMRDLKDWKRLCGVCHHKMDKIADKGWVKRKERYGHWGTRGVRERDEKGQFKGRPKSITI